MSTKLVALLLVSILLLLSCVQPYLQTDGVAVYVLCDYFHSGVLIQNDIGGGVYTYAFYTYGDRNWYLDRNHELGDGLHALLMPSDGVVEKGEITTTAEVEGVLGGILYEGRPNGWLFRIPLESLNRAMSYLENNVINDPGMVISSRTYNGFDYEYYATKKEYHLFYSCHQFTAEFLTIAGVDFHPVWYFYTNSILRDRLNGLTEMVL